MKNGIMKKILSVFVVCALCFLVMAPASVAVDTGKCDCDEIPLIYVRGRAKLYKDKSDRTSPAFGEIDEAAATEKLTGILPIWGKALVTNDFSEFGDYLVDAFYELYGGFALDENGEVTDNSGIEWTWSEDTLRDVHKGLNCDTPDAAGEYIYRYFYQYDCRLSPCESADGLHDYIEAVKKVTGHDKVNILARCLGSNVASAYFAEYGWDDINTVVLYNPITNGTAINDSLFTGKIVLDPDSVDFFINQQFDEDDSDIMVFMKSLITLLNQTYGLDMLLGMANTTIDDIAKDVVPKIMKFSYGAMPGYWSMVSPEYYEQAKAFIFADETEKYAGMIEKLDEWNYKVAVNLEEMYKQMEADGVQVDIVAKYGYQLYPVVENSEQQSDTIVTVKQQTFGAKAAPIGETLSEDYIAEAEANGTAKYISPDKIVDASKGLFPDTTWYIKDITHNDYPHVVDQFLLHLFRDGGRMNVWSEEEYPQYLVYEGDVDNNDSLSAMEGDNTGKDLVEPGFFETIVNFFVSFIKMIANLIMKNV